MPIVLLNHWTQQFSTPGEQAFLGITMMLVGVLLVLSILILISLVISLMSRIMSRPDKKAAQSVAEDTKSFEAEKTSQSAAAIATEDDNGAVIAVITAAVQMMLAQESNGSVSAGFKIKKIRRV